MKRWFVGVTVEEMVIGEVVEEMVGPTIREIYTWRTSHLL